MEGLNVFLKYSCFMNILEKLNREGKMCFSKLRYCSKPYVAYDVLEKIVFLLETFGLVETFYESKYPFRRIVKITDKGREFLYKLLEANKILVG